MYQELVFFCNRTCSTDLRKRVTDFVRSGGSKAEAARRFQVSRGSVHNRTSAEDGLSYKKPGPEGPRSLDPEALRCHVAFTLFQILTFLMKRMTLTGICHSVKLLHTVVSRLFKIDTGSADEFMRRWKTFKSPIHERLWAAFSKDSDITSVNEVEFFLSGLDFHRFCNLNYFPEIAELRSIRFDEFDHEIQKKLQLEYDGSLLKVYGQKKLIQISLKNINVIALFKN